MASKIAVVDFAAYSSCENLDETNVAIYKLAQEIYDAFTTLGFVYIKNHGIPESEISELFEVAATFFNQSSAEKNRFARDAAASNHGYVAVGVECIDPNKPTDFKEAFNVTEPFNNNIAWPDGKCSLFQLTASRFFQTCGKLALRILDLISLGLKLEDRKSLRRAHGKIGSFENKTTLRLLNYPVMEELNKGQVRLGEHSDYGTITLLFQDQSGGLEIQNGKEGFIPAQPVQGTILVNIGDLLQRWTNDTFVSTKHRVVVPRDDFRRSTPRQSMAFFIHPDNDVIIECLDGSGHYAPITALDYLNYRLQVTYPSS